LDGKKVHGIRPNGKAIFGFSNSVLRRLCAYPIAFSESPKVCELSDSNGRISDWCKQRSAGSLPASSKGARASCPLLPYAGERPPKVISAPFGDAPDSNPLAVSLFSRSSPLFGATSSERKRWG